MEVYGNRSYEYDKSNPYNVDYSDMQPEQNINGFYEVKEEALEDNNRYCECNEECKEKNEFNEYEEYCSQCYKLKDIAGENWEKSNELANLARKSGIQAKKAEEKAAHYKKLALEEYENANKLWEEHRCLSNESIELMREARKYMSKFEDYLRECDKGEHNCDYTCNGHNQCDCKHENRHKQSNNTEYRPERPQYRPNQEYGYGHTRR